MANRLFLILCLLLSLTSHAIETRYWLVFGVSDYSDCEAQSWDEFFKKLDTKEVQYKWINGSKGGRRFGENPKCYEGQETEKLGRVSINFNDVNSINRGLEKFKGMLDGIIFSTNTAKYFEWTKDHLEALRENLGPHGKIYIPDDEEPSILEIAKNGEIIEDYDDEFNAITVTPMTYAKTALSKMVKKIWPLYSKLLIGGYFEQDEQRMRSYSHLIPYRLDWRDKVYDNKIINFFKDKNVKLPTIMNLLEENKNYNENDLSNKITELLIDKNLGVDKITFREMIVKLDLFRVAINIILLKSVFKQVEYFDEEASRTHPYPAPEKIMEHLKRYYKCSQ